MPLESTGQSSGNFLTSPFPHIPHTLRCDPSSGLCLTHSRTARVLAIGAPQPAGRDGSDAALHSVKEELRTLARYIPDVELMQGRAPYTMPFWNSYRSMHMHGSISRAMDIGISISHPSHVSDFKTSHSVFTKSSAKTFQTPSSPSSRPVIRPLGIGTHRTRPYTLLLLFSSRASVVWSEHWTMDAEDEPDCAETFYIGMEAER